MPRRQVRSRTPPPSGRARDVATVESPPRRQSIASQNGRRLSAASLADMAPANRAQSSDRAIEDKSGSRLPDDRFLSERRALSAPRDGGFAWSSPRGSETSGADLTTGSATASRRGSAASSLYTQTHTDTEAHPGSGVPTTSRRESVASSLYTQTHRDTEESVASSLSARDIAVTSPPRARAVALTPPTSPQRSLRSGSSPLRSLLYDLEQHQVPDKHCPPRSLSLSDFLVHTDKSLSRTSGSGRRMLAPCSRAARLSYLPRSTQIASLSPCLRVSLRLSCACVRVCVNLFRSLDVCACMAACVSASTSHCL